MTHPKEIDHATGDKQIDVYPFDFYPCVVTIEDDVLHIPAEAFRGWTGLIKIYVPEKTTIAEDAFRGCVNLTTITHGDDPDQVYTAADFMFQFYTGTIKRKPRILPEWWTAQ